MDDLTALHITVKDFIKKLNLKPTIQAVCLFWRDKPSQWVMASSFTRLLDHTQQRTTVGRTPLDE